MVSYVSPIVLTLPNNPVNSSPRFYAGDEAGFFVLINPSISNQIHLVKYLIVSVYWHFV